MGFTLYTCRIPSGSGCLRQPVAGRKIGRAYRKASHFVTYVYYYLAPFEVTLPHWSEQTKGAQQPQIHYDVLAGVKHAAMVTGERAQDKVVDIVIGRDG